MVALEDITLNEARNREPIYNVSHEPIGKFLSAPHRTVVVTLRIDNDADLDRIRAALDALVNPPASHGTPSTPVLPA